MEDCLFCKWKEEKERHMFENELAFARYDEFAERITPMRVGTC